MIRPHITAEDLQIANRLRLFRETIRWSQAELAKVIGLTRNQIANMEAGRTPLRYVIAYRIRDACSVRLGQLAYDEHDDRRFSEALFPLPSDPRISKRSLLRDVAAIVGNPGIGKLEKMGPDYGFMSENLTSELFGVFMELRAFIWEWVVAAPDGKAEELLPLLATAARNFLKQFPDEPPENQDRRARALQDEELRYKNSNREMLRLPAKSSFDNVSLFDNNSAVPLTLKQILNRATVATRERGMKRKLADFLRVAPPRLSLWLHGKQEPGAESALRLLAWVTAEEAKQKQNAADVSPSTASKTQSEKAQKHEHKPKSGRRRH